MRISGILRTVVVDGYERVLEVALHDSATRYWVSALEPEQFVEFGGLCPTLREGQSVELSLELRYVTKTEQVEAGSALGLLQPIPRSPHCTVVAQVVRSTEPDRFVCSFGVGTPAIRVECEGHHNLSHGQVVAFTGELARDA